MQQWHKGLRPETATTWQQEDRGHLRQTAATFLKQEGNERDLQDDHQAGFCEASSRDVQRIAAN
jgi:hypothetical protein